MEASGERSIVAGASLRQALSGDGAVAYQVEKSLTLPPEALQMPPQAPSNMVNLPERTSLFVGRQTELARLDAAFTDTGGVVVQAVHGLGGIGKSTLAAKWAAGRTGSYNPVWWITAETPLELESGLAGLAVALQPALRDVLSQEALAERAVQWLAAQEGWLLVLDNVSDPADVRPLLGRTTGGRVLITTRRATGWHGIAKEPLSLDVLELPQAVELFEQIYGGTAEDAGELCRKLGCLPLAVEQAAAYCAEACISPRAYQDLLARSPERVFASTAEGVDAEKTIARVWQVTMARLADTPLAETMLRIIAWWAPDGIPRAYVEPLGEQMDVTEALRRLAAHSMISLGQDGTISVHRLVQAVARAGEGASEARDRAAGLLGHLASVGGPEWITHAESLIEHAREESPSENVLLLTLCIGGWLAARLSLDRAAEIYEAVMSVTERALGQWSEISLHARKLLAQLCQAEGDHNRAKQLLTEGLALARAVFGRKAPQTISLHTALAELKMRAGELDSGLSVAVTNARRAERALREEDPEVLKAREVVAWGWGLLARSDPDRYAERAAVEIERLLGQVTRSHGESSSRTLTLMWELSGVRYAAGDITGAIILIEKHIEKQQAVPGGIDLRGLVVRYQLVELLLKAGDHQRARQLAVPLLAEFEQIIDGGGLGGKLRDRLADLITRADDNCVS
ncbi:MAG: tetratricopeptide repeat protein [Streptomyces sp.]|nr:tetratricopeptide repeat protein [Streptomyces sp.]NUT25319.1 tetratricopeptide repeat protein [Streptomyces sp.]